MRCSDSRDAAALVRAALAGSCAVRAPVAECFVRRCGQRFLDGSELYELPTTDDNYPVVTASVFLAGLGPALSDADDDAQASPGSAAQEALRHVACSSLGPGTSAPTRKNKARSNAATRRCGRQNRPGVFLRFGYDRPSYSERATVQQRRALGGAPVLPVGFDGKGHESGKRKVGGGADCGPGSLCPRAGDQRESKRRKATRHASRGRRGGKAGVALAASSASPLMLKGNLRRIPGRKKLHAGD